MLTLKKFIICVAIGSVVLATAGLVLFVIPVGEEPPAPASVVSPDSVEVLSPRAQHLWDRLLAALEKKQVNQSSSTSNNSTTAKIATTQPETANVPAVGSSSNATTTTTAPPAVTQTTSATPALSAARDLTGTWTGSGVFYQLDTVTGERMRKITLDIQLGIEQTGEKVVVDMDIKATKVEPEELIPGHGYWMATLVDKTGYTIQRNLDDPIPEGYTLKEKFRMPLILQSSDVQWYSQLTGTVSGTTMSLTNLYETHVMENWTFTFTTDLMSGGVQSVPLNVYRDGGQDYFGHESDPKAFTLTRQK